MSELFVNSFVKGLGKTSAAMFMCGVSVALYVGLQSIETYMSYYATKSVNNSSQTVEEIVNDESTSNDIDDVLRLETVSDNDTDLTEVADMDSNRYRLLFNNKKWGQSLL